MKKEKNEMRKAKKIKKERKIIAKTQKQKLLSDGKNNVRE